jgi:hypothetical protein
MHVVMLEEFCSNVSILIQNKDVSSKHFMIEFKLTK